MLVACKSMQKFYIQLSLTTEATFQDPQWLPETMNSTKPYIDHVSSYNCDKV